MLAIAENPLALMPQFQRELGGRSPFGRVMNVTRQIDAILYDEIGLRRLLRPDERGSDVLSALAAPEPHEDGVHDRPRDPRRAGDAADRRPRDDRERARLVVRAPASPSASSIERLLAELDAGGDDYLDAVVKETLRQRPILPVTARRLTEEPEVGEFTFPRGLDADAVHLPDPPGPEVFPEPDALPARAVPRATRSRARVSGSRSAPAPAIASARTSR